MFCHKCGSQSLDGAEFCQKCGATLIIDGGSQQASVASVPKFVEPTLVTQSPLPATSQVSTTIAPKKKLNWFFGGLILTAIVIVIAIIVSISGGGDKYVQMVKSGTLDGYPQKIVGRAFDDFLDNPKWESGLSEDGERFVNAKGGILYLDKKADLVVQFIIDEDKETFSYNACEINGVPQNNLFFWGLLETIYNEGFTSTASYSQDDPGPALNADRIVVDETQSFDSEYGNLQVTLDYVEFIDRIENEMHKLNPDVITKYTFPDEGNLFLRAVLTVKNIGTGNGQLMMAWNTIVYDGVYEYTYHSTEGDLAEIKPLTPPSTGAIIFEIPNIVAESDGSLVLNLNDMSTDGILSFVIRATTTGATAGHGTSDGSGAVTDHDQAYTIAQTWLEAHCGLSCKERKRHQSERIRKI